MTKLTRLNTGLNQYLVQFGTGLDLVQVLG